jgi:hypothetical protein
MLARGIADRVDMLSAVGLQVFIHFHRAVLKLDAGCLRTQRLDVGGPASGEST